MKLEIQYEDFPFDVYSDITKIEYIADEILKLSISNKDLPHVLNPTNIKSMTIVEEVQQHTMSLKEQTQQLKSFMQHVVSMVSAEDVAIKHIIVNRNLQFLFPPENYKKVAAVIKKFKKLEKKVDILSNDFDVVLADANNLVEYPSSDREIIEKAAMRLQDIINRDFELTKKLEKSLKTSEFLLKKGLEI
jgi:spermidine/putrescine-binding protein